LLPTPTKGQLPFIDLKTVTEVEKKALTYMPSLEKDFGFSQAEVQEFQDRDKRGCYNFVGGEEAGLKRCKEYIT